MSRQSFEKDSYNIDVSEYKNIEAALKQSNSEPWQLMHDEASGHDYYFNKITGESSWAKDSDNAQFLSPTQWVAAVDESTAAKYYYNKQTGISQWESPQRRADEFSEDNIKYPKQFSSYDYQNDESSSQKNDDTDADANEFSTENEKSFQEAVSNLLETNEERLVKKFDRLKSGAVAVRRGGSEGYIWTEWQATNGAVFYSRDDQVGGQWDMPAIFQAQDSVARAPRVTSPSHPAVRSAPRADRLPTAIPTSVHQLPLTGRPMILAPSPGRAHTATKSFEQTASFSSSFVKNRRDVANLRLEANNTRDNEESHRLASMAYDDDGDRNANDDNDDEYGFSSFRNNSPSASRRNYVSNVDSNGQSAVQAMTQFKRQGQVDDTLTSAKDVYQNLLDRDVEPESFTEFKELKGKVSAVTERWHSFVGSKDLLDEERHDPVEFSFDKTLHTGDDSDEDKAAVTGQSSATTRRRCGQANLALAQADEVVDFNILYSRAIVVKQRWPWTCLVDMKTDKLFYRNEREDNFQLDAPYGFDRDGDESDEEPTGDTQQPSQASASAGKHKSANTSFAIEPGEKISNLVNRFKEELHQRRMHVARDHARQLVEFTTAAEERGLPDHMHDSKDKDDVKNSSPQHQAAGGPKGRVTSATISEKIKRITFMIQGNGAGADKMSAGGLTKSSSGTPVASTSVFKKGVHRDYTAEYSAPDADMETLMNAVSELSLEKEDSEEFQLGVIHSHDAQAIIDRLHALNEMHTANNIVQIANKTKPPPVVVTPHQPFDGNSTLPVRYKMMSARELKKVTALAKNSARHKKKLEEHRIATAKQLALNDLTQQQGQSREIVADAINKLTVNEDLWLEMEISRRHLLEAVVVQKSNLMMPYGMREAKAHPTLPLHICCPGAMKSSDIKELDKGMTAKDKLGWEIYTCVNKESSDSDSSGNSYLFVNLHTKAVQPGEPFNFRMRQQRDTLHTEKWLDYEEFLTVSNTDLISRHMSLLSDSHGGLLFYCPRRDLYSSNGKFDISFYDEHFVLNKISSRATISEHQDPSRSKHLSKSNSTKSLGAVTEEQEDDEEDEDYDNDNTRMSSSALQHTGRSRATDEGAKSTGRTSKTTATTANRSLAQSATAMTALLGGVPVSQAAHVHPAAKAIKRKERDAILFPQTNIWKEIFQSRVSVLQQSALIKTAAAAALENANKNNTKFRGLDATQRSGAPGAGPGTGSGSNGPQHAFNVDQNKISHNTDLDSTALSDDEEFQMFVDVLKASQADMSPGDTQAAAAAAAGSDTHQADNAALCTPCSPHVMSRINSQSTAISSAGSLDDKFEDLETEPLCLEKYMSGGAYDSFCKIIYSITENPKNPVYVLQFMMHLLARGLGDEALAAFQYAMKVFGTWRQTVVDAAMCQILAAKLCQKYKSEFLKLEAVQIILSSCAESSVVMAHMAMYLHNIKFIDCAEQLFVGSLMLDPLGAEALFGYSRVLLEQGNFLLSLKYLARLDDKSVYYPMSRCIMGWLQEMVDSDPEAILLAYRSCLALCLRDRPTSLSLHCLGHFYHSRSDYAKATHFYQRAVTCNPRNEQAHLLMACMSSNDNYTAGLSIAQTDSFFRKGLFMQKHKQETRWIALLAYSEFVLCVLKDYLSAEQFLREAMRVSYTFEIWPTIALAHYLQYVRDEPRRALSILKRCVQCRQTRAADTADSDDEGNDDDSFECKDKNKKDANDRRKAMLKAQHEDSEITVLFAAMAYCSLDLQDELNTMRYCQAALKIDCNSSCALRCLALSHWKKIEKRKEAISLLNKSMRVSAVLNPFTARSAAIVMALEGNYASAYRTMEAAMTACPQYALGWRALGVMAYLYDKNPELAVSYLTKACDLTKGQDVEAWKLKGQILMELNQFADARKCFQYALRVTPGDPTLLASLALALSALGFTAPHGDDWVDYDVRLETITDMRELISSKDPEELFSAAVTPGLERSVSLRAQSNGMDVSKNRRSTQRVVATSSTPAAAAQQDVPPEVLFMYGMYHLKNGSPKSLKKAKGLFTRAVQRVNCAPHPLALYMLGWSSELTGDLHTAEKYYCYAMQLEPIDPLYFLKLMRLAEDTLGYVKGLSAKCEKLEVQRLKQAKKQRKLRNDLQSLGLVDRLRDLNKGDDDHLEGSASNKPDNLDDNIIHMRKRLLLHERVLTLSGMRRTQLGKYLIGLHLPKKFVHIDPFWLERLHYAFSQCEDWSWLLRYAKKFKDKPEE